MSHSKDSEGLDHLDRGAAQRFRVEERGSKRKGALINIDQSFPSEVSYTATILTIR